MPIQHNIFFQQQIGGLCKLHSINGYFGKDYISISEYNLIQKEYDNIYKQKFNFITSCSDFDMLASDQKNIISFILKKYNIYTRYYSINEIYENDVNEYIINILSGDYFFIYNESHIWGCRLYNDKWYYVDSLRGVNVININKVLFEKNIGFIIPVDIHVEFNRNIKILKNIIEPNKEKIIEYLIRSNKEKKILGDIEIPLGICMDIFETNLLKKKHNEFEIISKVVKKYNCFINKFTKGNYNNIQLILDFLPDILIQLVELSN